MLSVRDSASRTGPHLSIDQVILTFISSLWATLFGMICSHVKSFGFSFFAFRVFQGMFDNSVLCRTQIQAGTDLFLS